MRFKYQIENPDLIEIKEDFMSVVGDIIVQQIEEKIEKGANGICKRHGLKELFYRT